MPLLDNTALCCVLGLCPSPLHHPSFVPPLSPAHISLLSSTTFGTIALVSPQSQSQCCQWLQSAQHKDREGEKGSLYYTTWATWGRSGWMGLNLEVDWLSWKSEWRGYSEEGLRDESRRNKCGAKPSEEIQQDRECLDETANKHGVEYPTALGRHQALGILCGEYAFVFFPCHLHSFGGC